MARSAELSACDYVAAFRSGRVVFTSAALSAVRLASHLADGGQIVICASLGAAISPGPDGCGPVVAYEADLVNVAQRSGWSVVVVGRASVVADEALATHYRQALALAWADEETGQVIAITADLVSGYRMGPGGATAITTAFLPILAG